MKTWVYESIIVAIILICVTLVTSNGTLTEWIGAAAVFCAFNHAQISDRLAERQAIKVVPDVKCYWKLIWFFITKEILWFTYFMLQHSYAALVGVILFILYPIWRKIWRHYYPIVVDVS